MSRYGRDDKSEREGKESKDDRQGKESNEQDLKDVLEEETSRGTSRRPIDTDARRERQEKRGKVINAAYEIDDIDQWRQYLREDLNLKEGTPQFEDAERLWMELKRKQYGG